MPSVHLVVALALSLTCLACGESAMQPNAVTVTGSWRGDLNSQVMILDLEETANGDVTGFGTISIPTVTRRFTAVSGTNASSTLTLLLEIAPCAFCPVGSGVAWTFVATVTANTITGTVNGSGLTDEPVTLTRQ